MEAFAMNKTTKTQTTKAERGPLTAAGTPQRGAFFAGRALARTCAEERDGAGLLQRYPASDARRNAAPGTAGKTGPIGARFSHDFSFLPSGTSAGLSGRDSENRTGLPDALLGGLQRLSGLDLSSLRVRYNSSKPAQVDALAYTRGRDIDIATGQERHMAHEGWHVVQQMQGRVKPTAAINGFWLNDSPRLEREADVMGAKAARLARQTAASVFRTQIAPPGGTPDDQPFTTPISRAPACSAAVVQRTATFAAGTANSTKNLAASLLAGDFAAGFTPPTLNGTTLMSTAAAQGAINAPTLSGRSNASTGQEETWVSSVPTNTASFVMTLPAAGPWSTTAAKANVAALFATLGLTAQAPCSTPGNTTFTVNGKPTSATFVANVTTHENLHVRDHRAGFNSIMVPWDTKLTVAQILGTTFSGPTVADAEAALFAAMGGTPAQIAAQQFNEWVRLNNVLHAAGTSVATGGTATPSHSAADATCSTSSMDVT
jgi:hypothetical protein